MKKLIRTALYLLVILVSLSACQSNKPTCYYDDEPINKVNLTINVEGDHYAGVKQDMVSMIKDHFRLCGFRLTTKRRADILVDISIYTDAWAYSYGRGLSDSAYTETATNFEIAIKDSDGNLIWEQDYFHTSEPYDSIYEGQYNHKGSAPYHESFVPILLKNNYLLFGDKFLVLLQDAYQDDETDFGEYLYDLVVEMEIAEPYEMGVFGLN